MKKLILKEVAVTTEIVDDIPHLRAAARLDSAESRPYDTEPELVTVQVQTEAVAVDEVSGRSRINYMVCLDRLDVLTSALQKMGVSRAEVFRKVGEAREAFNAGTGKV
ncbi:MAG: hypothetical protein WC992_02255 [Acholeplasmataceae bacterium]|jgi:hypothetical protein